MPDYTLDDDLTRLRTARTAIGEAIISKGGTVNQGDGLEEFPADILTIPSGGGGSTGTSDVNFYDYDGTIVVSYTSSEFADLTAMPDNPSHDGLIAQGWNWSLADAKAYVSSYGKLNIGQMYKTDDDKTRIHIALHDGRLSPTLGLAVNGSVDVDWGDGTAHNTMTGTSTTTAVFQPHTYAEEGDYIIEVTPSGGSEFSFVGGATTEGSLVIIKAADAGTNENMVYQGSITKLNVGSGVTIIGDGAFHFCHKLASVTIPDSVTGIGAYAFNSCHNLTSVTIPDSVTSIGNNAFVAEYALTSVTIPNSVTSMGSSVFTYCYNLTLVTIPDSVTSIEDGAFNFCYSLASVIIPDSVTSIGSSAFRYCNSLTAITIPDTITSIGSSAFYQCSSLTSVTIPDNVTSIEGSTFYYCYSLVSVNIPDNITSIGSSAFRSCSSLASITIPDDVTSIGAWAFNNCYGLASVTIPDGVTSIDTNLFNGCKGLGYIKFTSTTPPTASNANAFTGVPTDCIIYVPTGSLEAYKRALNYPKPSSYQYVEY